MVPVNPGKCFQVIFTICSRRGGEERDFLKENKSLREKWPEYFMSRKEHGVRPVFLQERLRTTHVRSPWALVK